MIEKQEKPVWLVEEDILNNVQPKDQDNTLNNNSEVMSCLTLWVDLEV